MKTTLEINSCAQELPSLDPIPYSNYFSLNPVNQSSKSPKTPYLDYNLLRIRLSRTKRATDDVCSEDVYSVLISFSAN